jgi:hypothetical protein
MFLGPPDPHPDPLVTITDPVPSSIKNSKKNLDFYCFVIPKKFLSLKKDVNVPVFRIRIRMFLGLPDPHLDPLVRCRDPKIRIHTKMSRIPNTTDQQGFYCIEALEKIHNTVKKVDGKLREPDRM